MEKLNHAEGTPADLREFLNFQNNFYILLPAREPKNEAAIVDWAARLSGFAQKLNVARGLYDELGLDIHMEDVRDLLSRPSDNEEKILSQLRRLYEAMTERGFDHAALHK